MEWYYVGPERETRGPHTLERLVELFRAGTIGGETLIWTKAMPDWTPARSCQEFFAALRSLKRPVDEAPPPLPPVPSVTSATPVATVPVPEPDISMEAAGHRLTRPAEQTRSRSGKPYLRTLPEAARCNPLHPCAAFSPANGHQPHRVSIGISIGIFFRSACRQAAQQQYRIAMLTPGAGAAEAIQPAVLAHLPSRRSTDRGQKQNPAPIGFTTAFARSFAVYLRGMALGFPLISPSPFTSATRR